MCKKLVWMPCNTRQYAMRQQRSVHTMSQIRFSGPNSPDIARPRKMYPQLSAWTALHDLVKTCSASCQKLCLCFPGSIACSCQALKLSPACRACLRLAALVALSRNSTGTDAHVLHVRQGCGFGCQRSLRSRTLALLLAMVCANCTDDCLSAKVRTCLQSGVCTRCPQLLRRCLLGVGT